MLIFFYVSINFRDLHCSDPQKQIISARLDQILFLRFYFLSQSSVANISMISAGPSGMDSVDIEIIQLVLEKRNER